MAAGRRQALARRLAHEPIAHGHLQSAQRGHGRPPNRSRGARPSVEIAAAARRASTSAIWTGRSFDDLAHDPRWRPGTRAAAQLRPPGAKAWRNCRRALCATSTGLPQRCPDETIVAGQPRRADPGGAAALARHCRSTDFLVRGRAASPAQPRSLRRTRLSAQRTGGRHEVRHLRPHHLLVLGQRPRDALARALPSALARAGTRVVFFERDVPYYADNRDLSDIPRRATRALPRLGRGRGRARATNCAMPTSRWSPPIARTDRRRRLVLDVARRRAGLLRSRYAGHARAAAAGEAAALYRPATASRDFDLVLSYTGGAALDALARAARRATRRAALWPCRSRRHSPPTPQPHYRADLSYLGTYSADRQPGVGRLLIEPARRARTPAS